MSGEVTQPHLDLQAPPPLPDGGLRVMALGGLGEIGRNMAVLEFGAGCWSSTAACCSRTWSSRAST